MTDTEKLQEIFRLKLDTALAQARRQHAALQVEEGYAESKEPTLWPYPVIGILTGVVLMGGGILLGHWLR